MRLYPTAESIIHEKNSLIFWFNNRVYFANNIMNTPQGEAKYVAFQLFHAVNGWTDMGITQVNNNPNFDGVLLPKNKEIAFYYYLKQLQ